MAERKDHLFEGLGSESNGERTPCEGRKNRYCSLRFPEREIWEYQAESEAWHMHSRRNCKNVPINPFTHKTCTSHWMSPLGCSLTPNSLHMKKTAILEPH